MISGKLAIGLTTDSVDGGIACAQLAGAVGTAATTTFADSEGHIWNDVNIINSGTQDEIITNGGYKVFALMGCASTANDGDAIGASGSENTQLSFVYYDSAGVIQTTTIDETIQFDGSVIYSKLNEPTALKYGGVSRTDIRAIVAALAADPSNPKDGQFWLNATTDLFKGYDGATTQIMASQTFVLSQINANIEGLAWKDNVVAATTAEIVIATALNVGDTIDGITLADGDRVLVKNQTTNADENGIYLAGATPTRSLDMNASAEFNSAVITVDSGGTANGGTTWRCTTVDPVVDTDPIAFTAWTIAVPPASTTVSGIQENADLSEADARTANNRTLTPDVMVKYAHNPSGASTDNAVPRWDGTGGGTQQDSGVIIDDSDNVTGIASLTITGTATLDSALSGVTILTSGVVSITTNVDSYVSAASTTVSGIQENADQTEADARSAGDRTLTPDVMGKYAHNATGTSVDNTIATFDGTGGGSIQDSLVTIDDNGTVNIPASQEYQVDGTSIFDLLPDATETVKGIGETSTQAEADARVSSVVFLVPSVMNDYAFNIDGTSVDNTIVTFDGTSGGNVQGTLITIDDNGTLNIPSAQEYQVDGTSILTDVVHNIDPTYDDNTIATYDGTTGDNIQATLVTVDDSGSVSVPTGQAFEVNAVDVLDATTLGSTVINSSLTGVGTLSSGNATAIVDAATTTTAGITEYAIVAEADARTSLVHATTPASLVNFALLSEVGVSVGAFVETAGVIHQGNTPAYTEDWVAGSPQLDDDGTAGHDARVFFDKDLAAFRAGEVNSTEWDTASLGQSSVAFGLNSIASGNYSSAVGLYSNAYLYGQEAQAAGRHAATGDAQKSTLILRADTTDATPEVMYIDNNSANKLVIPANTMWNFSGKVNAMTLNAGLVACFEVEGCIERDNAGNTTMTAFNSANTKIDTIGVGGVTMTADDTNEALEINITGLGGTNIRWDCVLEILELAYS